MVTPQILKWTGIAAAVLLTLTVIFWLFLLIQMILPFKKMKRFAQKIAKGEFEEAPKLPRGSMFSDFTKSFEIMKEELDRSRQREISLRSKENEIVDTLRRELKNPLNAIKLSIELIKTKISMKKEAAKDDDLILEKLDGIYTKADQVDELITDILSTALDDIDEFPVNCSDTESKVLEDMLKKHDEKGLVSYSNIPYVLIHIDNRRMSQVIANIISNSYKYANTNIDVSFLLTDDFLQMRISDHGPGCSCRYGR